MAKKAKKSKKGKKRTAAQKRATKKMIAGAKRARRKEKKMAAKKSRKRKKTTKTTKRRAKRRAPRITAMATATPAKKKRKRRAKKRTAKKRRSKKSRRATQSMMVPGTRVKIVKVPQLKTIVVGKAPPAKRRGKRRRKKLQDNPLSLATLGTSAGDGGLLGLLENPAGPLSRSALEGLGTASLGVGVGLVVASLLDRYVATRTPTDGKHPWYGRDAAAIINSRPDAWRMGAQAAGAVGSMALAYSLRGRAWLPWLLSGTAIGFGAKLVEQVLNWYLMPALLKSEDPTKATMGSRLYALEQEAIQKQVLEAYKSKAKMQVENEPAPPIILQPASPILQLGANPWAQQQVHQQQQETPSGKADAVGVGAIIATGRVGACASCKGVNGCYESCSDLVRCNECPGGGARTCEVEVAPGTDIRALAASAGVDIASVNALNQGTPEDYWRVGNTVELPFALCQYVSTQGGGPPPDYVPPVSEPAIVATAALHRPLAGVDLTQVGSDA